jgi:sugar lactone lactonase YvrE
VKPLLDIREVGEVFCGGIRSPHRLNHPEGLCVDPLDGALWCGGEAGELVRVSPDGSGAETVGSTGGFALGLCMDSRRHLFVCDLARRCVVEMTEDGREIRELRARQGDWELDLPNFPVLSADERMLYVSDTRREGGPGIWRFDLASGEGELWMPEPCFSANGMALAPDGLAMYLVESHLPGVSRIPIQEDGRAGKKEVVLELPGDEPDGLAFDDHGDLWISIYHPSKLYRCRVRDRRLELVVQDDTTDLLHHPTNLAFRGGRELFTANLGAWHLTRITLPEDLTWTM